MILKKLLSPVSLLLIPVTVIYTLEILLGLAYIHFKIFDEHIMDTKIIFLLFMAIFGIFGLIGVWLLFLFDKFRGKLKLITITYIGLGVISSFSISFWTFSLGGIKGSVDEFIDFMLTWGLIIFPLITIFYSKKIFSKK